MDMGAGDLEWCFTCRNGVFRTCQNMAQPSPQLLLNFLCLRRHSILDELVESHHLHLHLLKCGHALRAVSVTPLHAMDTHTPQEVHLGGGSGSWAARLRENSCTAKVQAPQRNGMRAAEEQTQLPPLALPGTKTQPPGPNNLLERLEGRLGSCWNVYQTLVKNLPKIGNLW